MNCSGPFSTGVIESLDSRVRLAYGSAAVLAVCLVGAATIVRAHNWIPASVANLLGKPRGCPVIRAGFPAWRYR